MNTQKTSESFLRLPVHFNYHGKEYNAELIGRIHPFNKYFTCRIPGENIVIMEATPNYGKKEFSWTPGNKNDFAGLIPLMGKEIEKYLAL